VRKNTKGVDENEQMLNKDEDENVGVEQLADLLSELKNLMDVGWFFRLGFHQFWVQIDHEANENREESRRVNETNLKSEKHHSDAPSDANSTKHRSPVGIKQRMESNQLKNQQPWENIHFQVIFEEFGWKLDEIVEDILEVLLLSHYKNVVESDERFARGNRQDSY
jgi:hypothetical protein